MAVQVGTFINCSGPTIGDVLELRSDGNKRRETKALLSRPHFLFVGFVSLAKAGRQLSLSWDVSPLKVYVAFYDSVNQSK